MSTLTKNSTVKQQSHSTKPASARWSAKKIRARLNRSFSKLCTQTGPSPWAEVEITEE